MTIAYAWKPNARIPLDAQKAGDRVEHLRTKANGLLTPAHVVDDARNPKSVLHPAFEWDDSLAAEAHRQDQARGLIRALVVTVRPNGPQREVRAFVNVVRAQPELGTEQGYTALHVALSDAEMRKQVLDRAWAELEQWRQRYENYREVCDWFEAAEAARRAA